MAWLRLYEEVMDDPKVMLLPPDVFRAWVLFLCASKARDGILPKPRQLAYRVRLEDEECEQYLRELIDVGLIDETEDGLVMHAWDKRQYVNDLSTSRVNKYRETRAKAGLTPTGYQKHRHAVLTRDGNACRYCGATEKLVLDHLLPVGRGGDDSIANLITACKSCNAKKRDRLPEECGMSLRPVSLSRTVTPVTKHVTPVTGTVTPVTPVTTRVETDTDTETDAERVPFFDLERAFEELWEAYPAKGRTRKPMSQQYYVEAVAVLPEDQQAAMHARLMAPLLPGGKWAISSQWSKGFVQGLSVYLNQTQWLESPEPAMKDSYTLDLREPEDDTPIVRGELPVFTDAEFLADVARLRNQ